MNFLNLLRTGLLLHIIGLTTLAGSTLSGYVLQRQFRKEYKDRQKRLVLMKVVITLSRLAGIGLGLQIVSGAMMLAATHGGFGQQLWFKIKMMVMVVVIVCIVILNTGMRKRLDKLVVYTTTDGREDREIEKIAGRMHYIQIILLGLFIMIFVLSVFRFN
jgi:hypothetical protein